MGAAITIEQVSKRFRLYHEKPRSLKERLIHLGRLSFEDFWALRDVSLEVGSGETVGLLGHNGSGKSTLLKLVAGIMRPTEGTIQTRGRVAALLELGTGFHPELTGRENVYLNAAILGISEREIASRFDDIVAFAELEQFVDQQVKHYSSGMVMRLGFAVAINVDPEVLLVDEVLAVGDEAFQEKCLGRVRELQGEGRTIVFVSHSPDTVRQICDRAAVLDHGRLVTVGQPGEAIRTLRELLFRVPETTSTAGEGRPGGEERSSSSPLRVTRVQLDHPGEGERTYLLVGEPLEVRVEYEAATPVDQPIVSFAIYDRKGEQLFGVNNEMLDVPVERLVGRGAIMIRIPEVSLLDGEYFVSVKFAEQSGRILEWREREYRFEVASLGRSRGRFHLPVTMSLEEGSTDDRSTEEGSSETGSAAVPEITVEERR